MTYRIQAKSLPCSNFRSCLFSSLIFMSVIPIFHITFVCYATIESQEWNFVEEKKTHTQIDEYNMLTHRSTHIHPIIELTVAGYWNYHIAISFPKWLQIKFWTSNYLCKFLTRSFIFLRYLEVSISFPLCMRVIVNIFFFFRNPIYRKSVDKNYRSFYA